MLAKELTRPRTSVCSSCVIGSLDFGGHIANAYTWPFARLFSKRMNFHDEDRVYRSLLEAVPPLSSTTTVPADGTKDPTGERVIL